MSLDVLIRGDGCVGRCLALTLSAQGLRVGLLGRQQARPADVRAYALNAASQTLLAQLRVWDALPAEARTPVLDMKVQAAGGRLDFSAWNAQAEQLAWIVDAAALDEQLDAALRFAPHVQRLETELPHQLLALCEGREAGSRAALGVQVQERDYGHAALAARLVAEEPHQGRAWQWFTPDGEVLALLPLDRPEPGCSYALVWSQPAAQAERRSQLDATGLEAELHAITGQALRLQGETARWPLRLLRASPVAGEGFALLGDCAHIVHPLAGQGLNLGLADVAALARVLREREPWRPLGDARLLRRYARARQIDTWAFGELTDALWLGLTQSPPWAQRLAGQGLAAVDRLSPLKRWLSQRAMGLPPPTSIPPMKRLFLTLLLAIASATASANEATIRKAIAERLPEFPKIDEVRATPIPGLFELRIGNDILYTDATGQFLLQDAQLVDLKTKRNLTQARINEITAVPFAQLPLKDAIVWKRGKGERRLAVFADPNCGYCKRLEATLQKLDNVTVYTFLVPILGPDSQDKSRAIWCAKDNTNVWLDWMLRNKLPAKHIGACDESALARNTAFTQKHRVTGTPAIFFEDGTRVPGAMELAGIEERLKKAEKS